MTVEDYRRYEPEPRPRLALALYALVFHSVAYQQFRTAALTSRDDRAIRVANERADARLVEVEACCNVIAEILVPGESR